MKINHLHIDDWYILKDFDISFDKDISVLIGENGSGKSSVIEAIMLIFGHLYKYYIDGDKTASFISGYTINFDSYISSVKKLYNVEIRSIAYQDENEEDGNFKHSLKIDGKPYSLKEADLFLKDIGGFSSLLPENIIVYYSGITERLRELSEYFEEKYRKKVTRSNNEYSLNPLKLPPDIPFLYSRSEHLATILLCSIISEESFHSYFTDNYLNGIDKASINIAINLKKPSWGNGDTTSFWGAHDGIIKQFLMLLHAYSDDAVFEDTHIKLSYSSVFPIIDILVQIKKNNKEKFLFRMLNLIDYNDLLESITLEWDDGLQNHISFDRISEGQKQITSTLGLISICENSNSLILLDEPDTFLHPKWQIEFINKLEEFSSNQIILTTHSLNMLNHANSSISDLLLSSKGKIDTNVPKENFGKTIAYINYNLMGIEERPEYIQEQLNNLFRYLENEDIDKASTIYTELTSAVGEDDYDLQKARIELEFLKSMK